MEKEISISPAPSVRRAWRSFVASTSGAIVEVLASLGSILDAAGESERALAALTEGLQLALHVGPRWVVAAILESIAMVAVGQGQDLVAVELASRAAALRIEIEVPVRPNLKTNLERTLAAVRATLGQEAFDAAWARATSARFWT